MAIYDYQCPKCGYKDWYVILSLNKMIMCSKCGAEMERQFPGGGITKFRHGGKVNFWYTKHSDPKSPQVSNPD